MRLRKIISYEPQRWYILNSGEKNGIKVGSCIEEANITAEYESVGKREQKQLEPFLKGEELEKMRAGRVFTMTRKNKKYNLATVYYVGGPSTHGFSHPLLPTVIDIHYHLNHSDNGYRTPEEVVETVENILTSFAYKKDLTIGAFARKKKHVNRGTKGAKHQRKVYTKV